MKASLGLSETSTARPARLHKALFCLLFMAEMQPDHPSIGRIWASIHDLVGRLSSYWYE